MSGHAAFSVGALVQQIKHFPFKHRAQITWLSTDSVWVDQWPLTGEKLAASTALVEEQLKVGHIELFHSPWNTLFFVIKKKLGRWRLLKDLRAVNRVMQLMGVLQPGFPSPTAIPLNYCLCILDLKDFFFPFFSIQKTEKNLLSLYHHQIIRALGIDFIGQCCPKS
jgi:hypothetical protein